LDRKGIVIDPFCGTGQRLLQRKFWGHDYIGIDISKDYVDYTLKRLDQAEKERNRVLKEISLHAVELTFEERKEMGLWDKKLKK
jgi:DNA modification methylase